MRYAVISRLPMVRLLTVIVMHLRVLALGALVPRGDLPVSATALASDGADRPHFEFRWPGSTPIGYLRSFMRPAGCALPVENEGYMA